MGSGLRGHGIALSAVKTLAAHAVRAGRRAAISATASSRKACISSPRASASRNAAGAQIEQRIRIQVAHRRAMGAFDVVGEDFQFRLEIGLGAVAQQQRLGGLDRLSLPLAPLATVTLP